MLELEGADLTADAFPTPKTPLPGDPVPETPPKMRPQKAVVGTSEDEELEALQKEMAL